MEDLRSHVILPKEMMTGTVTIETMTKIAHHLGVLHRDTSRELLGDEKFADMVKHLT